MKKTLPDLINNVIFDPGYPIVLLNKVPYHRLPHEGFIEDSLMDVSMDQYILIQMKEDEWSASMFPLLYPPNGFQWWKFSYAVDMLEEHGMGTRTKNGIRSEGVDALCHFFHHYWSPEGERYHSFLNAYAIAETLGYRMMISTLPVIPVILDASQWEVGLVSSMGRILFSKKKSTRTPFKWERETIAVFPDILDFVDMKKVEDITKLSGGRGWIDGDELYVVAKTTGHSTAGTSSSMRYAVRDVLKSQERSSMPWYKSRIYRKMEWKLDAESGKIHHPNGLDPVIDMTQFDLDKKSIGVFRGI